MTSFEKGGHRDMGSRGHGDGLEHESEQVESSPTKKYSFRKQRASLCQQSKLVLYVANYRDKYIHSH